MSDVQFSILRRKCTDYYGEPLCILELYEKLEKNTPKTHPGKLSVKSVVGEKKFLPFVMIHNNH